MAKRVNKRFLIILTSIVVVGGVVGMGAAFVLKRMNKKDPQAFVAESKQLEAAGDIDGALGKFGFAVGSDPNNAELRYELGNLYYRHVDADPQNFRKAHLVWQDALGINPRFGKAMTALLDSNWEYAKVAPSAASFKEVRLAAQRVLDADPKNFDATVRLNVMPIREAQAKIPTRPAEVEKAITALRELSKQKPEDAELVLWAAQGDVYLAAETLSRPASEASDVRDRAEKLEAVVTAALLGQEKNPAMQVRAAQIYMSLASLDAALAQRGEAVAGAPAAATQPTTRGSRPPAGGRFADRIEAALAAAREHVKPDDEMFFEAYSVSAEWYRMQMKLDERKQLIEKLAEVRADDPNVRVLYAKTFQGDAGKRDKVIEMLARKIDTAGKGGVDALKAREQDAMLKIELCNYRLTSLDGERDQEKRKSVIALVQDDLKKLELLIGAQSVPMLELRGRVLLLQGKLIDAIPLLQQAVDRNPESRLNIEARLQLAQAYSLNQQTGQAEKLLRQIATRVPEFTAGRVQWIQTMWANGQYDEARAEVKKLKDEYPKTAELAALEALVEGGAKREAYVEQMPEGTKEERLRKAVVLRADGKLDEAIELAAAAFNEDPKFLGALEQLLSMYMQANRRDEALAAVQVAIKANPDNKQVAALPEFLTKRTPEEFEKWQLERIQQEKDPIQRSLALHAFHVQKLNAATQSNDEAAQKAAAAEAEKNLADAERARPSDPKVEQKVAGTRFAFLIQQKQFDEAAVVLKRLAAANADEVGGELLRYQLSIAKKDLAAAEGAARQMTSSRPQFALGWQLLGQVLQAQGRFRDAAAAYSSALERQGRNYDAIKGLVDVYERLNDPVEAKQQLDRARAMFPNDVALREKAFEYEMKHGDPKKVVAERERILKAAPEVPQNALALADTYLKTMALTNDAKQIEQILEKSRALLEQGRTKWPQDGRFIWPLAQVLAAQGDFLGGEKLLKEWGQRDEVKDRFAFDLLMADYYMMSNKPATAEQTLRDALPKAPDGERKAGAAQKLATLLANTDRAPEALKLLEGVSTPGAAAQRVRLLSATGKRDDAERVLREAIAASPNSEELSNLQFQTFLENGRIGDAEQLVQARLAKNENDDGARYYGALAKLRKTPPDNAGAIKELTALADRNPRAANVLTLLAEAYWAAGDQGSAIDAMNRALQMSPVDRAMRAKLIDWCAGVGQWDLVTKLATEAMATAQTAKDPAWPRALANAYSATGRFADAEKQIAAAQKLAVEAKDTAITPELERDHLMILAQSRNYKRILQITDGWLAKGRKEWWLFQARGVARSGLKDKTAVNEFDKALAGLNPEEQFGAAATVVRAVAQAVGPAEALKRIEKWEAEFPRWRLVAAEICTQRADVAGALAHLLPLESQVDKLTAELRGQYYRALGQAYHTSRPSPDVAKAAEAYKKYLELNPGDVMALNNLAYVLAEEVKPPQPQAAKVYSQKAYELTRDWKAGEGKSRIWDTHGWVLVLNGGSDIDAGVRVLEEIVDEAPLLEAHYHLAEAHLQRKRPDDAEDQLNRALAMIEKYKKEKHPYDETLEPRIKRALETAKTLNAAAGAR